MIRFMAAERLAELLVEAFGWVPADPRSLSEAPAPGRPERQPASTGKPH